MAVSEVTFIPHHNNNTPSPNPREPSADPGFWSGGASRVVTPGGPEPKIGVFPFKNCLKTACFIWKNLGGKEGPLDLLVEPEGALLYIGVTGSLSGRHGVGLRTAQPSSPSSKENISQQPIPHTPPRYSGLVGLEQLGWPSGL